MLQKIDSNLSNIQKLLEDDVLTDVLDIKINIEKREFFKSFSLGKYLSDIFSEINKSNLKNDCMLWDWLSCYFFDMITYNYNENKRSIGEIKRYILDQTAFHYYKHHIYSSWYFYDLHGEKSKIFLNSNVYEISVFSRQISRNKYIVNSKELINVLYTLYWDEKESKLKTGYSNINQPGNVTRFPMILNQIMLTYDIFSLSEKEILDILPHEFDRWKK